MGGLSIILFGTITATGVKMCLDADLNQTRNLIIMAITLSLSAGLASGPIVHIGIVWLIIGPLQFDGLGFSSIVCVLLYLILARLPESYIKRKSDDIELSDIH